MSLTLTFNFISSLNKYIALANTLIFSASVATLVRFVYIASLADFADILCENYMIFMSSHTDVNIGQLQPQTLYSGLSLNQASELLLPQS